MSHVLLGKLVASKSPWVWHDSGLLFFVERVSRTSRMRNSTSPAAPLLWCVPHHEEVQYEGPPVHTVLGVVHVECPVAQRHLCAKRSSLTMSVAKSIEKNEESRCCSFGRRR